jgi:hypothetical protein
MPDDAPRVSLSSLAGPRLLPGVGAGWDTFTGSTRDTAVNAADLETSEDYYTYLDVKICSSFEEVVNVLNVSANVSVSTEGASADAKTSFLNSLAVSDYSTHVVVRFYRTDHQKIDKLTFIDQPQPDMIEQWVKTHGDSYVREALLGVEYYAVYSFHAYSRQEQNEVKASLNGSGVADGIEISAGVQTAVDNLRRDASFSSSFDQILIGGGAQLSLPTDESKTVDFASKLNNLKFTNDDKVVSWIKTEGYETVGKLGLFHPVIQNRRLFADGNAFQTNGIMYQLIRCLKLYNSAETLEHAFQVYHHIDDGFRSRVKDIKADIANLQALANKISDDPFRTYVIPTLNSKDWHPPQATYTVSSLDGFTIGNDGGDAFEGINRDLVQARTRLETLRFNGGNVIEGMTASYVDGGRAHWTNHYGGTWGSQSDGLTLTGGEQVTRIRASVSPDEFINFIEIWTQDPPDGVPPKLAWPPRPRSGPWDEIFDKRFNRNQHVIGFDGRASGWFMRKLTPIVLIFTSVSWDKNAALTYGYGREVPSRASDTEDLNGKPSTARDTSPQL